MTSGKMVYPIMQTDWKNELLHVSFRYSQEGEKGEMSAHVSSKKFDLQCHNCFADPDHGEDARKDKLLLFLVRGPREEEAQQEAE